MSKFKPVLIKLFFIFSVIIAGMCLFAASISVIAGRSVMKAEFHEHLFEKNKIYSHAQSLLSSSMNDFIDNLKKNSAADFEKHTDIIYVLQKSTTPEMIKTNLDSIRDGLFEFFKGKRQFLPDIYLDTRSIPANSNSSSDSESNKLSYALTKIDKISLSLVLQYINRNDINDRLSYIKLAYFVLERLPGYTIPVFLLLLAAAFLLNGKNCSIFKWAASSFAVCGLLGFVASISLAVYSYKVLPANIFPIKSSIPLQSEVLISYIRDCISSILQLLTVSSVSFIILSALIFIIPGLPAVKHFAGNSGVKERSNKGIKAKYLACAVVFVLITSVLTYKAYILKKEFYSNDFPVVISKIKNANTVTQVISAKDTVIYSLLVKIVDKKTGEPVPNVEITVNGESVTKKKTFYQALSTDDLGEARYSLDKGTFRVSFSYTHFPTGYQMPSPFYFDLKTAGTKIITVSLENSPENDPQNWGIAEIEVLDKDNKPVPDLNLEVQGIVDAPGLPNNILSITNSEGISVFKLNEGIFKVGFSDAAFPDQYEVPSPIDVTVAANTVTRYTIRLVENKKSKSTVQ